MDSCCPSLFGEDQSVSDAKLQPPPLLGVLISFISTFVVICISTTFYFGPTQLFFCLVFVVFLSTLAIQEGSAWERRYPSTIFYAPLGLFSALTPIYIGIKIYVHLYSPYYLAKSGRTYNDVSPFGLPAVYADGGILRFTNDAALDTSRSFGFQGDDATYCAAPVVSRYQSVHPHSTGPKISFWAVGMDCCGNRNDFECDGAGDYEVRNAFTVRELSRDLITKFLVPKSRRDMYLKAVEAAKAVHNLQSQDPGNIILLRWAAKPSTTLEVWNNRAIGTCVVACVIYSIFITVVWTSIHFYILRNLKEATKQLSKLLSPTDPRRFGINDPFSLNQGSA